MVVGGGDVRHRPALQLRQRSVQSDSEIKTGTTQNMQDGRFSKATSAHKHTYNSVSFTRMKLNSGVLVAETEPRSANV